MIISISGLPGSGKSTVAKMLAERLNLKHFSIGNDVMRKLADKRRVSLLELMKIAQKDPTIDKEADEEVQRLGRENDNFIIESRTAFHFIPHSFKVFVKVDFDEAAKRIWRDMDKSERKNEEKADSLEELEKKLAERAEVDRKRYLKYYNIDFLDENNYDVAVNSTSIPPEEVIEKILNSMPK